MPEDFGALYERHYSGVLNYLYRLSGKRETAEDLTSQTFLLALRSYSRGARPALCRPWLFRIATNVYTSHGRSLGAMLRRLKVFGGDGTADDPQVSPRQLVEDEQISRLVRVEMMKIPEIYRIVLVLRFDEELDHNRIAEILEIREVAGRARLSRGLAILRARMEKASR